MLLCLPRSNETPKLKHLNNDAPQAFFRSFFILCGESLLVALLVAVYMREETLPSSQSLCSFAIVVGEVRLCCYPLGPFYFSFPLPESTPTKEPPTPQG
eukprot:m.70115 g.70115  ORF g.70115 m.70115 type:complete len:99 (-) comp13763_c0_seq2:999-1295(-)